MATSSTAAWILVVFLMAASSSVATVRVSRNAKTDLAMAIEEMQKANYFTFVVLINLAPPDELVHANLTFLMPKDMSLSGNTAYLKHPSSVADFLLRHSIPSPLLLEHLLRFPTGSILPTSQPGFFLNITSGGRRRNFSLNNVRITSPNICTRGSSIRCHGVDGVIQPLKFPSTPRHAIPPPPPATPSPTAFGLDQNCPNPSPPPSNSSQSQKSGSRPHLMIKSTDLTPFIRTLTCTLMLLAVKLSMH